MTAQEKIDAIYAVLGLTYTVEKYLDKSFSTRKIILDDMHLYVFISAFGWKANIFVPGSLVNRLPSYRRKGWSRLIDTSKDIEQACGDICDCIEEFEERYKRIIKELING